MGAAAQDHTFHKMAFEKLPSLNTPRGNHRTVVFDGEVAVFGGHTTGFKPLETAEYYKNGSWHSIPMTWPHDGGAITLLKDGRLFLAGGNAEASGFASRAAFLRTFKAQTGLTPTEWKQKEGIEDNQNKT